MSSSERTPITEADLPTRETKILAERIRARLTAIGISAEKASTTAGLGRTFIHDLEKEHKKSPSLEKIQALTKVLKTHLAYLTGESNNPNISPELELAPPVRIIAIVEAGAFRKMPYTSIEREDELATIDGPKNLRYPNARRFGVEVRGDSMNAAKEGPILPGMIALCVDMEDAGLEVETGNLYVIRRTLDHGQSFELTIKRAYVFRNRIELRPESTNPIHETLVVPRDFDADHAQEIKAIGLVYAAVTTYS